MSQALDESLLTRCGNACELCGATSELVSVPVGGGDDNPAWDPRIAACATCADRLGGADELQATHWFCLKESIWSEVPAVQVTSFRLLSKLAGEGWVDDLLGREVGYETGRAAWTLAGRFFNGTIDS